MRFKHPPQISCKKEKKLLKEVVLLFFSWTPNFLLGLLDFISKESGPTDSLFWKVSV